MKPKAIITVLVPLVACTLIASDGTANAAFPSNESGAQVQVQQPGWQPHGSQVRPLSPVGRGISYQGQLKYEGSPANGQYDFAFTLYDAVEGGTQVGSPVNIDDQTVTEGVFKVSLDFGVGVFQGEARWLEIAVRPAGSGSYTTLTPRQALAATPYAASLVPGAVITGSVASPIVDVTNTYTTTSGAGLRGTAMGVQSRGVVGVANNGAGAVGVRGDS